MSRSSMVGMIHFMLAFIVKKSFLLFWQDHEEGEAPLGSLPYSTALL
jgi:hypothetical protein